MVANRSAWADNARLVGLTVAALALGGASAGGVLANMFLQIVAIGFIAWSFASSGGSRDGTRPLAILCGLLLLMLAVQLVPIPSSTWASIGPRAAVAEMLRGAGALPASLALSLDPRRTVEALLSTLPGIAAALLALRRPPRTGLFFGSVVGFALLSVLLGVAQITGGPRSPFYIYDVTSRGQAVGFFANRNHLATLLVSSLACLPLVSPPRGTASRGRNLVLIGAAVLLFFGIVITGSRAGLMLAGPVAIGGVLIARNARFGPAPTLSILAVLALVLVGAVVMGPDYGFGTREPFERGAIWANTALLIGQSFPLGTGLGTFADMYRTIENPLTVTRAFINHAHNDYLEVVLEAGILGMLAVAGFLIWWASRFVAAWRSSERSAKAAALITAAILLHSLVDYPLRTAAILVLFAACCAILARPLAPAQGNQHA